MPVQQSGRPFFVEPCQRLDRPQIQGRLILPGLDHPGEQAVAEVFQHSQPTRRVKRQNVRRGQAQAAKIGGDPREGFNPARRQARRGVPAGRQSLFGRHARPADHAFGRRSLIHQHQRHATGRHQSLVAPRRGIARQGVALCVGQAGSLQKLEPFGLTIRTQARVLSRHHGASDGRYGLRPRGTTLPRADPGPTAPIQDR